MHHLLSCCICQSKKDKEKKLSRAGQDTVPSVPSQENNVVLSQQEGPATQRGDPASQRGGPASQRGGPASQRGGPASQRGDPVSQRGGPASQRGGPAPQPPPTRSESCSRSLHGSTRSRQGEKGSNQETTQNTDTAAETSPPPDYQVG